ncbi:MAG TPA: hypothetical protein VN825_08990 [Candidatus Acidoferrum sp.]|nr:hypothetical protein [Candidatus Acidoferrum sp.]
MMITVEMEAKKRILGVSEFIQQEKKLEDNPAWLLFVPAAARRLR